MGGFVVVWMAEPIVDGNEVDRSRWPLHLTLSTNFDSDRDAAALRDAIEGVARSHAPVACVVAERAMFGPHGTVPVVVVEPVEPLRELHLDLISALGALGAEFRYPQHLRDEYRPHIADVDGELSAGDRLSIDAFTLFELSPPGAKGRAMSLGSWRLLASPD